MSVSAARVARAALVLASARACESTHQALGSVFERLRIPTFFLTTEKNPVVRIRAERIRKRVGSWRMRCSDSRNADSSPTFFSALHSM